MIFRRVKAHIEKENCFAVLIDFVDCGGGSVYWVASQQLEQCVH
jgi:hypothetical protein